MSNECGSSTQKGWTTISSGKTEEEKNDRRNRKSEVDTNKEGTISTGNPSESAATGSR